MPVEPFERSPGKWLFDYHDAQAHGRRRWGTEFSRDAALSVQAQRENEWRMVKGGLIKPEQLARGQGRTRGIEAQLLEYEGHLKAKRVSAKHLKNTLVALRRMTKALKVTTAGAIQLAKVEALLQRWMEEEDLSPRMRNFYGKALKAMCQLLEDRDEIPKNPLRRFKAINEEVDQRNVSRPLSHAEFEKLLMPLALPAEVEAWLEGKSRVDGGEGAEARAPEWQELRKAERRLFYLLIARTGLRWEEAARLRWGSLDKVTWWLDVKAGQTKTKKSAALPVPTDLVEALDRWQRMREKLAPATPLLPGMAAEEPDDRLFPNGMPRLKTWKSDLVAAGLVAVKGGGAYRGRKKVRGKAIDRAAPTDELVGYASEQGALHRKCVRLSFGTWLYEAGVDIREAQRLMRHADINLTSKIYTRLRVTNLQAAAEKVTAAAGSATLSGKAKTTA